ncbi:MAG TPA: hypothetical protein VJ851_02000 [Jatrophihabitans sp.]|nr:hypothetical protein [Jatrophihabitans sp.]
MATSGLIWLLTLASWLIAGAVFLVAGSADGSIAELVVIGGLAVVAVLATIGWGALVARRRATRWLWPAALAGTTVQMMTYVIAMLAAPQSPGSADNDTAAGAGIVLLTIPTAVIILILLWFGAALGALSRLVVRPRQHAPGQARPR